MRIDSFVVRRPFGNYTVQFGDSRNIWYQGFSRLEIPRREPVDPNFVAPLPADSRECVPAVALARPAHPRIGPHHRRRRHVNPMLESAWWRITCARISATLWNCPPSNPPIRLAFFLFQRKKGHCEYFASAMAVMLRTLDIPSRVVTGFQSGIYNPISGIAS